MPRILVSDSIAEEGLAVLREAGDVDYEPKLDAAALRERVGGYEALVVRSRSKVTRPVIEAGRLLQVIGRAGVGVDNIDVEAATEKGVLVVNSPGGNTLAVAELALGMMLALARKLSQADQSVKGGDWAREKFIGVQLMGKTVGLIGLGRIGTEVARRAQGLGMRVTGYDPLISPQRAKQLDIDLASPEQVFAEADFVSLHTPLVRETQHLVDAAMLDRMKPSAYLINCARGGVVDEEALVKALREGRLAGAALDVYETEPEVPEALRALDNVLLTPHVGAQTVESQVGVAVDVATQIVEVLRGQAPRDAVNLPSLSPGAWELTAPYLRLADRLGCFQSQLADGPLEAVELSIAGDVAEHPTEILVRSFLKGLFSPMLSSSVNLVNALALAESRGLEITEQRNSNAGNYASLIQTRVRSGGANREIAGTVFQPGDPRVFEINGYRMDVTLEGRMLVIPHLDRPGIIGRVGMLLGNAGINIARMQVGRKAIGGTALMVLSVDDVVPPELLAGLKQVPNVHDVKQVELPAGAPLCQPGLSDDG